MSAAGTRHHLRSTMIAFHLSALAQESLLPLTGAFVRVRAPRRGYRRRQRTFAIVCTCAHVSPAGEGVRRAIHVRRRRGTRRAVRHGEKKRSSTRDREHDTATLSRSRRPCVPDLDRLNNIFSFYFSQSTNNGVPCSRASEFNFEISRLSRTIEDRPPLRCPN